MQASSDHMAAINANFSKSKKVPVITYLKFYNLLY